MEIKCYLITLFAVAIFCSCNSEDGVNSILETDTITDTISVENVYVLGDPGPAGGIVFYDAGNYDMGWRYIEVSNEDFGDVEWGCFNAPILDARNDSIGAGMSNTLAIVEFHDSLDDFYNNPVVCSDKSNGTVAAKSCYDLEWGGFDDWYLPSAGEMLLMREVLYLNDLGSFDENALYWTSTEHDSNTVPATNFADGTQGYLCKQCDFGLTLVRPVRYF